MLQQQQQQSSDETSAVASTKPLSAEMMVLKNLKQPMELTLNVDSKETSVGLLAIKTAKNDDEMA